MLPYIARVERPVRKSAGRNIVPVTLPEDNHAHEAPQLRWPFSRVSRKIAKFTDRPIVHEEQQRIARCCRYLPYHNLSSLAHENPLVLPFAYEIWGNLLPNDEQVTRVPRY